MTACYKVVVLGAADRDARKIDRKYLPRILSQIRSLSGNPFPKGSKKLKAGERGYRVRVGDHRILYEVDTKARIITIYHIRHRKEAYRAG